MRILIVEDDQEVAQMLKSGLEFKGFAVDWIENGEKALTRILLYRNEYDLIILDLTLPVIDGAAICKDTRKNGVTTPIIILTASGSIADKLDLLTLCADDYVVKPFAFPELLARIQCVLRRPKAPLATALVAGYIEMDTVKRTVRKSGISIPLTLKEYSILETLMRHPNEPIRREDLMDHLWDFGFSSLSNVLDVHIKNLRKKLSESGTSPIETVRGVGYKIVA